MRFGIARYLYGIGNTWVEIEPRGKSYTIKKDQYAKLSRRLQEVGTPAEVLQPNDDNVATKSSYAEKRDQPEKWAQVVQEMRDAPTLTDLEAVILTTHRAWMASLSNQWKQQLRDIFAEERQRFAGKEEAA